MVLTYVVVEQRQYGAQFVPLREIDQRSLVRLTLVCGERMDCYHFSYWDQPIRCWQPGSAS